MNSANSIGLLAGILLGVVCRWLQWSAAVRAEKKLASGRLARVPGAMTRVALLLATTALSYRFANKNARAENGDVLHLMLFRAATATGRRQR